MAKTGPPVEEMKLRVEEIMLLELTKSRHAMFGLKKQNKTKNVTSVVYNLNLYVCNCWSPGLTKNIDLSMRCNLFFSIQ